MTVDGSRIGVAHVPHAGLRPIDSAFGHDAGSGSVPAGKQMIDAAMHELLAA